MLGREWRGVCREGGGVEGEEGPGDLGVPCSQRQAVATTHPHCSPVSFCSGWIV